ncbi:glycosyltransferase [Phenylobacterium sp. LjRoot219]|uniref:glycosyltransferase family 2 protein n=1 Tax=Phenylobacterium sp. LjRoot219 TaxID=3342283 RepID=UPI003ECDC24B
MGEPRPLLSVVIPCFNYEHYVAEAIESVLSQAGPDVEVIVVDDGSTDGSWRVIQQYAARVAALRIENSGSRRASLAGFARSTGRFIYFLDADDMLCPGALALIRPHLLPDVSKIQFMLRPVDHQGNPIGEPFPSLEAGVDSAALIAAIRLRGCYPTPPTSGNVYRRDVYEDVGDPTYDRAIDGVAYLLAPFVGRVVSIDRPLGAYRIHGANLSAFAVASPEKMDFYYRSFVNRLSHLAELLAEKGVGFQARGAYAHSDELQLMRSVTAGQRPGWALTWSYLTCVMRERSGLRRGVQIVFALALFGLPVRLSSQLIRARTNPSGAGRWRAGLKALATSARRRLQSNQGAAQRSPG